MNFPTERGVWSHAKKKWGDFHAIEGERSQKEDEDEEEEEEEEEEGGEDRRRDRITERKGESSVVYPPWSCCLVS